ncbi:hypothetical protein C8F01DRAFT_528413 [Mycena amicta]|nr:hypothetical protein C8F01DRAFT_528413 [Mycena amicta]
MWPGLRRVAISTLDPARLTALDFVDLSSRTSYLVGHGSRERAERTSTVRYHVVKRVPRPFPPRTMGFLYYQTPKHASFLAGSIRFRCVPPSAQPHKQFQTGVDLLRADGCTPWELPLVQLTKSRPILRRLLLKDGLVTKTQLAHCEKSMSRPGRTLLHAFRQPFVTTFDGAHHMRLLLPGGAVTKFVLRGPFDEQRNVEAGERPSVMAPYKGQALVRFELSSLPQHTKDRKRFGVVRVLKIIAPPSPKDATYDGYLPPPVEGEVVRRRRKNVSWAAGVSGYDDTVWALNLDSGRGRPLGMLLDAEVE